MAKLTKEQSRLAKQALDLVHSDKSLTWDERKFILENYAESQGQLNALAGAYFTPYNLAADFSIELGYNHKNNIRIVDLCAGIGMLSFACEHKVAEITCVEFCEEYVKVGKRVMPNAEWICADVFTVDFQDTFNHAISNPPFGKIPAPNFKGKYTGAEFEYKIIELASRISTDGTFIIPANSAPFKFSGQPYYRETPTTKTTKFTEQTGIELTPNCGIDTTLYKDEWRGVSPFVEIVCCEFTP